MTAKPIASAPPSPPPPAAAGETTKAVNVPKLGTSEPKFQPPRIVINGVEGWGKTTLAAMAPKPGIYMARGESGYETLLGVKAVPNIPNDTVEDWAGLMVALDELIAGETMPYKTLAFDAMGGFERLCHEHVCVRDFHGDLGERGFAAYQKGYDVSVTDWLGFLARLDKIRARGVMILLLSHSQVRPFRNPMGEDFDRYTADVHHKTWSVTHKWADAVLFANFIIIPDKSASGKTKGIGGSDRIIYTQRRDAFDAKNRYAMEPELDIPDDPKGMWPALWAALTGKEPVQS